MIYLDYNATTPIDPRVAEAMRPFIEEQFGNPSSGHALGRAAKEAVEAARASVARLIGAKPQEVFFTSGGTEASNWAIKGAAGPGGRSGAGVPSTRHVVTSCVEHPATIAPLKYLEGFGVETTAVGVDGTGLIDPGEVRRAIRRETILVSVMHSQNEVGTIEPIEEIGRTARDAGALFHVDAAQSIGKIPFDVRRAGADLVSIAGHKMYAPKGIGALYVREGVSIETLIHGAGQEAGRRAGTESVVLAVGLGKAAELAAQRLGAGGTGDTALAATRDRLWEGLRHRLGERVILNGHPILRLPNTLNVSIAGVIGAEVLERARGLCASTGSACHSGETRPSSVLVAMGLDAARALGAIRLSVGRTTSMADADRAVEILAGAVREISGR